MGYKMKTFWPAAGMALFLHAAFLAAVVLSGRQRPATATAETAQAHPRAERSAPTEKASPERPNADPLKEAFAKLVRQNAADPTGLEILEWKPLEMSHGTWAQVRFRCKLIGHTPNVALPYTIGPNSMSLAPPPGTPLTTPVPVLVDTANVSIEDGAIVLAHVGSLQATWRPSRRP